MKKHPSLLIGACITEKKFYENATDRKTIVCWVKCFKTFYGCDLQMFVISYSDKPFQPSLIFTSKAGANLSGAPSAF